ncbi:YciI family protein [Tissierella carlieri]|uniref:YciI family protein n=1 Tax=Tissierella carlieri TaxID=689904 RepID=UPI00387047A2
MRSEKNDFICCYIRNHRCKKDSEILDIHKAYLQKFIDEGKIFAKGPFTDHSGGLVIYKANSYEEAKEMAENDPAVLQKSRTLILKEWRSNIE